MRVVFKYELGVDVPPGMAMSHTIATIEPAQFEGGIWSNSYRTQEAVKLSDALTEQERVKNVNF